MELKFTRKILYENNEIFLRIDPKNIWSLLQEFIIIEIILNNQAVISSVEIQNAFENFFFEDQKYLPKEYFEKSNSSGKSKLRDRLNNWVSSNLDHKKGLGSRKEIVLEKRDKFNFFKVNSDLLLYFKEIELTPISMFNFGKIYPYFKNYYSFVCNDLSADLCDLHNKSAIDFMFAQKPIIENTKLFMPINSRLLCSVCLEENYKRG